MPLQYRFRRALTAALAPLLLAGGLTACGGDDGAGGGSGAALDTPAAISAYLEGKTLKMEGASIPSHPNGYDENTNFGNATQCYTSVTMTPTSASWHVVSVLGTLDNAPATGDTGTCNHDAPGTELSFDSTAILIENVTSDCFDFTATYVGFGQEGRASITEASLSLEIFFKGQATGHRCGDGAIGAQTVTLSGMPFTGDAVQQYTIE